jgi:hypothetical protein
MNSRLPVSSIAILSQSSHTIGLFELFRIHQGDAPMITWVRPKRIELEAWIRPQAILGMDYRFISNNSETIQMLTSPILRLATDGTVSPNSVIEANMVRLSYNVSFWEHMDQYPLYTIYPDDTLPWSQTVRTASSFLHIQQQPQRHLRLQQIPFTPSYMAFASSSVHTPAVPVRRELVDDVCPITLEPLSATTAYWTPCGHPFSAAIQRALSEDPRCPMCRAICYFSECLPPT